MAPDEYATVLGRLASDIARRAQLPPPENIPESSPIADSELSELAERLWHARGESLVVSDSQTLTEQILVNYINHALGNYGRSVDVEHPSRQRQGNDAGVVRLIDDLKFRYRCRAFGCRNRSHLQPSGSPNAGRGHRASDAGGEFRGTGG